MERVDAWPLRECRLAGPGDRRTYSGSSERLCHGRCAVCSPACGSARDQRARTGIGNRLRPPRRQRTARCRLPPRGVLRHPSLRCDHCPGWCRRRGRPRRTGPAVPRRAAAAPDIRRIRATGLPVPDRGRDLLPCHRIWQRGRGTGVVPGRAPRRADLPVRCDGRLAHRVPRQHDAEGVGAEPDPRSQRQLHRFRLHRGGGDRQLPPRQGGLHREHVHRQRSVLLDPLRVRSASEWGPARRLRGWRTREGIVPPGANRHSARVGHGASQLRAEVRHNGAVDAQSTRKVAGVRGLRVSCAHDLHVGSLFGWLGRRRAVACRSRRARDGDRRRHERRRVRGRRLLRAGCTRMDGAARQRFGAVRVAGQHRAGGGRQACTGALRRPRRQRAARHRGAGQRQTPGTGCAANRRALMPTRRPESPTSHLPAARHSWTWTATDGTTSCSSGMRAHPSRGDGISRRREEPSSRPKPCSGPRRPVRVSLRNHSSVRRSASDRRNEPRISMATVVQTCCFGCRWTVAVARPAAAPSGWISGRCSRRAVRPSSRRRCSRIQPMRCSRISIRTA